MTRRQLIRRISRRRTLQGLGATVGTAALGCGDDGSGAGGTTGGSTSSGGTTGATTSTAESSGSSSSGSGSDETGSSGSSGGEPFGDDCGPMSDMPASELLAPVETVVVVMMENRSFDHYFGALSLEEGAPIDGLTGAESNLDGGGVEIPVFKSDYYVVDEDPPHGWGSSRDQWNAGANDGFVTAHENEGATLGEVVMGYHTRDQLSTLYSLASNFVVCDRWFSSVMGPTHVSPPTTFDDDYPEFQQLGFRVPSLVVGPHVRRGCALSEVLDHVSVPATATRKWDLEPLNNRTAMTSDISAAIDPRYLDDPQPPVSLPPVEVRMPKTLRLTPDQYTKHQIELWDLAERGGFPKHLDRRGAVDETIQEIMRWGVRLGAVKLL